MPTSEAPPSSTIASQYNSSTKLTALTPLKPSLHERAWASVPHPTLPLIATAHAKSVTVFSLSTLSKHSALTGGHSRSVRCVAWKPGLPPHKLGLVTGSFDATAGLWRWDGDGDGEGGLEVEITAESVDRRRTADAEDDEEANGPDDKEWEFTLVLEGHDSELKSCGFSPSGAYLATCSRDKSVWIWEDIGATEADDEWETVAVLNEHDGDVKAVAWCPDIAGRSASAARRRCFSADVLASASYDDTIRIWREDGDGEWVCVAVLEGHEATVWGVQWEGKTREGDKMPRLMSWSADGTIRVWELQGDEDQDEDGQGGAGMGSRSALGGIPNTMRRSLREDWICTAILPNVHDKDIYSVAWSSQSGLVASTGSDGILALYREDGQQAPNGSASIALEPDAMDTTADGSDAAPPPPPPPTNGGTSGTVVPAESSRWHILTTQPNAHGPYEVNHVTWCRRFDAQARQGGEEEMLVTTGDDGVVRPWALDSEGP